MSLSSLGREVCPGVAPLLANFGVVFKYSFHDIVKETKVGVKNGFAKFSIHLALVIQHEANTQMQHTSVS